MELVVPSSACLELSLPATAQFLAKYGGKDKMIRIVQYGARALRSLLVGDANKWSYDKVQKLMVATMEGRRTFRWFSFVPFLSQLRVLLDNSTDSTMSQFEWWLLVISKVSMILWNIFDHVRWLQQITWAPTNTTLLGDASRSRRVAFSFFAIANVATFALNLPRWVGDSAVTRAVDQAVTLSTPGADCTDDDQVRNKKLAARRACFKAWLMVLQCLHISEWLECGDLVCGGAGVVTSVMDCVDLWPKRPLKGSTTCK